MYLRDRAPLLLNYNPQLTFQDETGAPSQARATILYHRSYYYTITTKTTTRISPFRTRQARRLRRAAHYNIV